MPFGVKYWSIWEGYGMYPSEVMQIKDLLVLVVMSTNLEETDNQTTKSGKEVKRTKYQGTAKQ